MNLDAALRGVNRLAIEAAPFIYFVEQHATYVERVRAVFQRVARGELEIVTSTITLAEVLVLPMQHGYTQYEREYRDMLLNTEHIGVVPVSPEIAILASRLRATYRLRTPDAIHVATAIDTGCDALLTNDRALLRVTELPVLVVDDLELTAARGE